MAISSEFVQAVREKNTLRVRIMLKDSLLVDKTFGSFDEMQAYASIRGVSPWADVDIPLEKAEKPWTEDIMNYELTALVNDFTKEHVNYVKEIISDIYRKNLPAQQPIRNAATSQTAPQPVSRPGSVSNIMGNEDPHKTIINEAERINRFLKKNKDKEKRTWKNEDIERIRRYAQKIVDACNRLYRRD